jgi:hypothetical protein
MRSGRIPSEAKKIALDAAGGPAGGFAAEAAGASDMRSAKTVRRTGIRKRVALVTEHLHD